MDMVDIWIEALIREYSVDDMEELSVYIVKKEIYKMKDMLTQEEVFLAGGSAYAKENIKNIKKFIKVLMEVLEL
jgi:butyrate kinase